ncbi:MAG: hypothetical protein KAQ64_02945 [Candidatus Pacebacteria bacterium]|nr:hypothetical protein [Candidatus Paceibacterota bacterium]
MKIIGLNKISKLSSYIILSMLFFLIKTDQSEAVITLTKVSGVPTKPIADVLDDIIKWILGVGIMIAITFLVWGGINYIASTGDAQKTENSKKIVKYSILGLLVMGLSYAAIVALDVIFK